MQRYWFKAKTYGYGWTPATWEGWLVTGIYLAAITYLFFSVDVNTRSASDTIFNFTPDVLVLSIVFIFIVYKTGEKPHWSWGKKQEPKKD